MTAVTFPLLLPRLAFAICGRRWQNDVYENEVWCVRNLVIHRYSRLKIIARWSLACTQTLLYLSVR